MVPPTGTNCLLSLRPFGHKATRPKAIRPSYFITPSYPRRERRAKKRTVIRGTPDFLGVVGACACNRYQALLLPGLGTRLVCGGDHSLAGQLLRKREEGSGVMPIRDLYRCSQPLILCGYWYAGRPIRGPLFLFNKRLGLSLPRVLTNQVLDLHEAGDHNNLLKTKSRHLIGQPEYLDSPTILVVTWRDLFGLHSWLQRYKSRIGMTPDPSSLLRRGWPARLDQILWLCPCYYAHLIRWVWLNVRDLDRLGAIQWKETDTAAQDG